MTNFSMTDFQSTSEVLSRLRIVRWLACVDAVLLIALVTASLNDQRDLVGVLGPIHGANFLLLAGFVFAGAADRFWSWWYLAATVATGGPLGAFVGERVIARRLVSQDGARLTRT